MFKKCAIFPQFPKNVDNFHNSKGPRPCPKKCYVSPAASDDSYVWHTYIYMYIVTSYWFNVMYFEAIRSGVEQPHYILLCDAFLGALVTPYLMTIPCVWLYISKLSLITVNRCLIGCDFHQGLIFLNCITRYYSYMYN